MEISQPDELRIYIVIRRDIGDIMSKPKFGVQVAHATLAVFIQCLNQNPDRAWAYWDSGKQAKIVLQVKNTKQLLGLTDKAKNLGFFTETITDAGRTEFSEPTLTAVAIGPLWYQREGEFLKRVRLYPHETGKKSMTYRQLLEAIEHAQSLHQMIAEIEPLTDDGEQKGYKTEDLFEIQRINAILDSEISEE